MPTISDIWERAVAEPASSPAYLVKLPPELEKIGVLIEPLTVVEKGIQQAIEIQRRLVWELEEAVVTGAGPIGLMATFLLRSMGIKVKEKV